MPAYNSSAFAQVSGLVEGQPAYSMGTAPVGGPCKMFVTKYSVTSNVVTLTVQIQSGNIPLVNDLISVLGLPVAALNVTNVALSAVSITASTGVGTVAYSATTSNTGTPVSYAGQAISIPQPTPEAIVQSQAGQAFAIPRSNPAHINGRPITLNVQTPAAPGNLSYNLQVAISNNNSEFVSLGANLSAAGTTLFNAPNIYNFVRYIDTGSNNLSSGTVIAKILI